MSFAKHIVILLGLQASWLLGIAQDTIFLSNKTIIVGKVLEITPDYIRYKKIQNLSGPSYLLPVSMSHHINYENGFTESQKNILYNSQPIDESFEAIDKRFESGLHISPFPSSVGLFIQAALSKKYFATLEANYIFKGITHVENSGKLNPKFYSAPDANLRLGKWIIHNSKDEISLNLIYDFLYKRINKYKWKSEIGNHGDYDYDYRSEYHYSHNLIFSIQESFKKTKNIQFGYFVGLGVQWGKNKG